MARESLRMRKYEDDNQRHVDFPGDPLVPRYDADSRVMRICLGSFGHRVSSSGGIETYLVRDSQEKKK
ncbi:hypothetical protein COU59_03145 [Candidatus Pacearchaeota archaeon CG10_big_fil_rev_8_21_14_0_10_34_12]|nr:MAG: hypothetical protein COU59_03145 [Candidatus Pacearchaeota archaeon CG10_big_fil_rev_8_21_14_0_10_34_12]